MHDRSDLSQASPQALWDTLVYDLLQAEPDRNATLDLLEHLTDALARGEPVPRMHDEQPVQFVFRLPQRGPDAPTPEPPLLVPEEDFTRLLVSAVEDYIEREGLWQLVLLPGIYEALCSAFTSEVDAAWRRSHPPTEDV